MTRENTVKDVDDAKFAAVDTHVKTSLDMSMPENSFLKAPSNVAYGGFKSANGKLVNVIDESKGKAKEMLAEWDMEKPEVILTVPTKQSKSSCETKQVIDSDCGKTAINQTVTPEFSGFQAASGKKIILSEESLRKATKLVCDIPDEELQLPQYDSTACDKRNDIQRYLPSKSHSGMCMDVDYQPVAQSEVCTKYNWTSEKQACTLSVKSDVLSLGTGTVAKTSLGRAEDLSAEIAIEINPTDVSHDIISHQTTGFKSASGREFAVKKSPLKLAEALGRDVTQEVYNHGNSSNSHDGEFTGFKAASRTTIPISKDSIEKAVSMINVENSKMSEQGFEDMLPNNSAMPNKRHQLPIPSVSKVVKPTKDYSKLPKGFRPFKPPRISVAIDDHETGTDKQKAVQPVDNGKLCDKGNMNVAGRTSTSACANDLSNTQFYEVTETLALIQDNVDFSQESFTQDQAQHGKSSQDQIDIEADKVCNSNRPYSGTSVDPSNIQTVEDWHVESTREIPYLGTMGFSTASGASKKVSDNSLRKAREILQDTELQIQSETNSVAPSPMLHGTGFYTAGGTSVSVLNEALLHGRNVLASVDDSRQPQHPPSSQSSVSSDPHSCKDVQIVPKSPLKKSDAEPKQNIQPTSFGFQTARGNTVQISDEALARARNILANSESNDGETAAQNIRSKDFRNPISNSPINLPTTKSIKGFQTALGCTVSVSDKSLEFVRGHVGNDDSGQIVPAMANHAVGSSVRQDSSCQQTVVEFLSNTSQKDEFPKCSGFQTAACSKVNVSEKSMKYGKSRFNENEDNVIQSSVAPNQSMGGFQTAEEGKVPISEKTLKYARSLCDEGDQEESSIKGFKNEIPRDQVIKTNSIPAAKPNDIQPLLSKEPFTNDLTCLKGFHTGSGSAVTVSEEALSDAREQLSKTNVYNIIQTSVKYPLTCKGFQTAGGTKVPTSAKALVEARELLSNWDADDKAGSVIEASFKGFQTCSGKQISVSTEAIEHAKQFFDDPAEPIKKQQMTEPITENEDLACSSIQTTENVVSHSYGPPRPPTGTHGHHDNNEITKLTVPSGNEDISVEAYESAKALLADGDFLMDDSFNADYPEIISKSTRKVNYFNSIVVTGFNFYNIHK